LNNKELLPHISKTQKQKICDNCFSGKTTVTVTNTPSSDHAHSESQHQASSSSARPLSSNQNVNGDRLNSNKLAANPKIPSDTTSVETKVNPLQTSNPVAQRYLAATGSSSKLSTPESAVPANSVIKPHRRSSG
jgi:hypothetical protein